MMKNKTTVLSALIATALLVTLPVSFAASQTDKTTKPEVSKEVTEAIEAIKGYTANQRDEAAAHAQMLLEEFDARIERLEDRIQARWEQMRQPMKESARPTLEALRRKRAAVADWYGRLPHSSDRVWDHIKTGLSDAYSELSDAWEKAIDEFAARD
jgi:hypothetical protein